MLAHDKKNVLIMIDILHKNSKKNVYNMFQERIKEEKLLTK